jgi:hypothetical protein
MNTPDRRKHFSSLAGMLAPKEERIGLNLN